MTCLIGNDGSTICFPPAAQPLTRYSETVMLDMDSTHDKTFRFRNHPRKQVRCHRCRRLRWARNLLIIAQGGYDPMVFCVDRCRWSRRRRGARRVLQ